MRLFIAGMATETNSFSPLPTGMESFEEGLVAHGDATSQPIMPLCAPLHVWRTRGESEGHEIVESLTALAQPGGPTVKGVFEAFRDEIVRDLEAAHRPRNSGTAGAAIDIVLLGLHGAMIADGYDDCEGDLLSRLRDVVGPDVVIGATVDPHSHLTQTMRDAATILVAYKEYPHTDIPDRAAELYELAIRAAAGEIRPVMRDYDCRMIAAYHTPFEPIRSFVDRMKALEGTNGILSASLIHGFAWGDTERTGTRTLVVANEPDGGRSSAEETARRLGEELFSLRRQIKMDQTTIDEALDQAELELCPGGGEDRGPATTAGPIVLADMSDNAGGGAPSDATFLLRAVLDRCIENVAAGIFWDPMALRFCREAGEGSTLALRLGGKCGPVSGDPLDFVVTVMAIRSELTQRFGSIPAPLGGSAWVRVTDISGNGAPERIDVVINDVRTQTFHPDAFEGHGIDLSEKSVVLVKSSQHFYAGFSPISRRVIHVATPGAIAPDFANIPYKKRRGPYWPKVEDPFTETFS